MLPPSHPWNTCSFSSRLEKKAPGLLAVRMELAWKLNRSCWITTAKKPPGTLSLTSEEGTHILWDFTLNSCRTKQQQAHSQAANWAAMSTQSGRAFPVCNLLVLLVQSAQNSYLHGFPYCCSLKGQRELTDEENSQQSTMGLRSLPKVTSTCRKGTALENLYAITEHLQNRKFGPLLEVRGWRTSSVTKSITALAEDLGLVPSILMVAHNHV